MLKAFQTKIGYEFKNPALLETAFIHRSYVNENRNIKEHNERLEFLGDAVLELVVTEFLYAKFPEKPEGELTTLRSALVKGEHLAVIGSELGIGQYLKLSKGEARSGGAKKPYLLANVFEALIGAIYLDAGYRKSHAFIKQYLIPNLEKIIAAGAHIDAKSEFQELAQARLALTPHYEVLSESGPDHAKVFEMGAYVGSQLFGKGKGNSKQTAEQAAAEEALKKV
jgi:ribonuclease-3